MNAWQASSRHDLDNKVMPAKLICRGNATCDPMPTGDGQWTCPQCHAVYSIDPLRCCWVLDEAATEDERYYVSEEG